MKLKTPKLPGKRHHEPVAQSPAALRPLATAGSATSTPGVQPASPLKKVTGGLAAPARQRNAAVMLAGAAFVIVAAALGASVANSFDDSLEVLVASGPIVEGQPVDADDFRTVKIAAAAGDIEAVSPGSLEDLVGRIAAGPIGPGAMIHPSQFTIAAEETLLTVGAQLGPNQYPAGGLKKGDFVRLIAVSGRATSGDGEFASGEEVAIGEVVEIDPLSATNIHFGIRLPESSANVIAQLVSQNRITLALIDKSIDVDTVQPLPPAPAVDPLELTEGTGE